MPNLTAALLAIRVSRTHSRISRPVPDPSSCTPTPGPSTTEPKSTPLMLWGWVLDQDIYEPGTLPICSSLSERYERFVAAMKTARVSEAARFKGFVSMTRLGQPMSQFCFHFASNRNKKDRRKRLSNEELVRLMDVAGTTRWPSWIEIPGSASPSYLEVEVSGAALSGDI
ncbi:hypothetical protein BDZ89DRAFT_1079362 [Hymenopellis radicata]|nr:hypothetical protein BDZ89DRAFT_1079362 [Hymenopellis radicata]